MHQVLFGTTLLASFLGGVVALLAPCCVSVMLPAYLASGFRAAGATHDSTDGPASPVGGRVGVVAATLVFAAGVATLILPIGLGASAISSLLAGQHRWVYSAGGIAMLAAGLVLLAGFSLRLPMPQGRTRPGAGLAGTYLLGLFSGAASACCAPVLAGVALLAGASNSFPVALAIGLAYVAGMVAPLLAVALMWERRAWGQGRWLAGRAVRLRLAGRAWALSPATLATGLLMAGMGVLSIVSAVNGPSMPSSGWRVSLSAWLQHQTSRTTHALSWLPGWVFALVLMAAALGLYRFLRRRPATDAGVDEPVVAEPVTPVEPPASPGTDQTVDQTVPACRPPVSAGMEEDHA